VSVRKPLFLTLTAALLMVQSALAQSEARIQVVQPGIDQLKSDLKYLVELSPTPALKKQWGTTLEPLLDSFAEGLDPTKPIRVDILIGKNVDYEMHFPVKKLSGGQSFLNNLNGMGFNVKPLGQGGNLYTVTQGNNKKGGPAKNPFFMRYLNGYGSFAPNQAAVPANLPDPIGDPEKGVKALLAKGYDVAISMKNSAAPADVAARKANFKELRKQLEAGLSTKRSEDKSEFALRKLSMEQNLNEAERFVVDIDEFLAGWTTTIGANGMAGKGRSEFSLTALPNSDLEKSAQALATKSSHFANVTLHKEPAVSGKINFGLDKLREDHLKEFYKTVRPTLELQIDRRVTFKTAEQKKAVKAASNILIDMLNDTIALGVADLFMDLHSAGDGKHTLVCGARVADGKKADEIVKLLPQVNASRDIKLDMQKIGDDFSVHSVGIPDHRKAAFQKLFPGEQTIYVATSKDTVWGAAGVDALKELEAAIKEAAKPAPEAVDPRVVYFTANAARLIEVMDILRPEEQPMDEKLTKDEKARIKQRDKDLERVRKLAVEATAGCDSLFSGEIKKDGNKVDGWMDVSECVLKFIGAVTADFAKDMQ
jgi:hypothetical protein